MIAIEFAMNKVD